MPIGLLLLVMSALICLAAGRFHLLNLSGGPAWLISGATLILMLVAIGWAVHKRFDGVLIDRDNRISLSRFQLILWTVLVTSGLQAAGIFNTTATYPQGVGNEVMLGPLDIMGIARAKQFHTCRRTFDKGPQQGDTTARLR